MSHPALPTTAALQRGAAALGTALRLSTLLPREQEAVFAILRALNAADEAMFGPATDAEDGYAGAAGILISLIDTYRRALAALGGSR